MPEIIIDACGHLCPVPTLKLRRVWATAAPGTVLTLIADDPMARIDAPHFAADVGMTVLAITLSGKTATIRLQKPA